MSCVDLEKVYVKIVPDADHVCSCKDLLFQGMQNGNCFHPGDGVMLERNGPMKMYIVELLDKGRSIYVWKMFDANIRVHARAPELYWPCERCIYHRDMPGIE